MITNAELGILFETAFAAWHALAGMALLRTEMGTITVRTVVNLTIIYWMAQAMWEWATGQKKKEQEKAKAGTKK